MFVIINYLEGDLMEYIKNNKTAWEEAYENRAKGWDAEDVAARIKQDQDTYLEAEMIALLDTYQFDGKTIAQFCCNNGRELLCLYGRGAKKGYGFDIAENMIAAANRSAMVLHYDCEFISTDLLQIGTRFNGQFDMIFITIGALTWFRELNPVFKIAHDCLATGGVLILQDMHPVTGMFGAEGEADFDRKDPKKILYSYFREEPRVETSGIAYMTGKRYSSKTFTSFTHTLTSVIGACTKNKFLITGFHEYDRDISEMFENLNGNGIPLSYILTAEKV